MSEETRLKPASKNPWYVMMTIAGEHGEQFDERLNTENRRYWHGFIAPVLPDDFKAKLIEQGKVDAAEFEPLTKQERTTIAATCSDRDVDRPRPGEKIYMSDLIFEQLFSMDGFASPGINFSSSEFSSIADFWRASFSGFPNFEDAKFSDLAGFGHVMFSSSAVFVRATFSGRANFRDATFSGHAYFEHASFAGPAKFERATFLAPIDFSDSDFQARTVFSEVVFETAAPKFFNAKLHEDTVWYQVKWPSFPQEVKDAHTHRRAYERLKLLMDSQNKAHAEIFFHRKELECREVEDGFPRNIPSRLYGLISSYGWSVARPAFGIFALGVLGFLGMVIGVSVDGACPEPFAPLPQSCGGTLAALSFSNILGFLGLGRSVLSTEYAAFSDLTWFEVIAGVQFFLGPVMLFFVFLALRNRYRMR